MPCVVGAVSVQLIRNHGPAAMADADDFEDKSWTFHLPNQAGMLTPPHRDACSFVQGGPSNFIARTPAYAGKPRGCCCDRGHDKRVTSAPVRNYYSLWKREPS